MKQKILLLCSIVCLVSSCIIKDENKVMTFYTIVKNEKPYRVQDPLMPDSLVINKAIYVQIVNDSILFDGHSMYMDTYVLKIKSLECKGDSLIYYETDKTSDGSYFKKYMSGQIDTIPWDYEINKRWLEYNQENFPLLGRFMLKRDNDDLWNWYKIENHEEKPWGVLIEDKNVEKSKLPILIQDWEE